MFKFQRCPKHDNVYLITIDERRAKNIMNCLSNDGYDREYDIMYRLFYDDGYEENDEDLEEELESDIDTSVRPLNRIRLRSTRRSIDPFGDEIASSTSTSS